MDRSEHLKNLVALAFSVGNIDEGELKLLKNAAEEAGISESELNSWIENADSIILKIPENEADRENHLIDMIGMATADNTFSQDEYDLCMTISEKLGYDGLGEALNRKMSESNLKNLIALASADGHVDEKELEVIKDAAKSAGFTSEKLQDWLKKGSDFIHVIPEREEDRETQLIQMLSLAIADGEFSADEYALCKTVAERLGFTKQELDMIIKLSFRGEMKIDFD
ncbi:MAG: hypothetical protein AAFX57_17490 [Bacteroidota bacterium]